MRAHGILAAMSTVLWVVGGWGEQGNFWWWPEEGFDGLMSNRFGQVVERGWVVQGVWVTNKAYASPPWTNAPYYVSGGDVDVMMGEGVSGDVWRVGYDNIGYDTWCDDEEEHGHTNAGGRGAYKVVSRAASSWGCVRVYSGVTVTGAAYYAATAVHLLTEPNPSDYVVGLGEWKVNPAYEMAFAWGPTNAGEGLVGTGQVWGVGSGLNEYEGGTGGIVRVRYRLQGMSSWTEGGKVSEGGLFGLTVNESGVYEVQAYAESEMAGLPCSKVVTVELVPEPTGVVTLTLVGVMVIGLWRARGSTKRAVNCCAYRGEQ